MVANKESCRREEVAAKQKARAEAKAKARQERRCEDDVSSDEAYECSHAATYEAPLRAMTVASRASCFLLSAICGVGVARVGRDAVVDRTWKWFRQIQRV